eukprot:GEMP01000254.1.p1 GENE.GEMP01000254.1~~GEMP01000254.1.p1  ORF type:complete len:2270 (-),score=271.47 GEMP01000254.1:1161-7970(-)
MSAVSAQRNTALSAAIGAVVCTTFSLVALHTQTSGGLKSVNYMKYDNTKCEVTCDRSDPNCAREFEFTAWGTLKSQEERDFEAWQKCKNACTDLDDCRGFDLTMFPDKKDDRDYYTCTLFYQFIHTCDYIANQLCFVKECIQPPQNDPSLHPEVLLGKECYRLPRKDKWGMKYPMLWQHPVDCPSYDLYCKDEGEECGAPERQCKAGQGLICQEDCRYNMICKQVHEVKKTDLLTHALLQCPFESGTVDNATPNLAESPVLPAEDFQYEIQQSDVQSNPYKIKHPGTYKIMEDITFDFPEAAADAGSTNGLHAGKIHGIEILTSNVVLDLNGKTLKMSAPKFNKQRFFTHIVIGSQVFENGQAGFTTENIPQNHVLIKNGKLGKTSHFGIRGLESNNVRIENVEFTEFEVAAVNFGKGKQITISNCTVDNRNLHTAIDKNYGVFFQLYRSMSVLETKGHKTAGEPKANVTRFPDDFFDNPNVQALHLSTFGPNASDPAAVTEFTTKKDGSPWAQGNSYGFVFSDTKHVTIQQCTLRGLFNADGHVRAVKLLDGDGPVINVDGNALLYNWFWDEEGNRKDNKLNLTEKEKLEILLFQAQVWAKVESGDLNGINFQFVQEVLSAEKPEMPYVRQWVGNDIRGHVDAGAHAISLRRGTSNVLITGVTINGVHNTCPPGLTGDSTWMASRDSFFLSSEPAVWRGQLESHRVNHAADAYGIRSSNSNEVQIKEVNIVGVRSENMHAFGVAVTGSSHKVGVEGVSVSALSVGVMGGNASLELPNLRAKAMPFFRERDSQENVAFMNIIPESVYITPAPHCTKGCPKDGDWEVTWCDTTGPSPPPVDCLSKSVCNTTTCVETVIHTVESAHGGKPCPYTNDTTFNCCQVTVPLIPEKPVNCEGNWSPCDLECQSTFQVFQPVKFGGKLCETPAGTRNATKCLGAPGCEETPNPDITKPVHCEYVFVGECDENCSKRVKIIKSQQNGGTPCPTFSEMGERADCQPGHGLCPLVPSQPCDAEWSQCIPGTCLKKYRVILDATGAINACPYRNGTFAKCAGCTNVTLDPVSCVGEWNDCNPWTCQSTFVVSQTAINGGSECSHFAGETRGDGCTGNCTTTPPSPTCGWGECTNTCKRVYSAGGRKDCPVADGTEEHRDCRGGMGKCPLQHCEGAWSECDGSCIRTFTITQSATNGGNECSQVDGAKSESDCRQKGNQTCPAQVNVKCQGNFTKECNNECKRTFVYDELSSGNGAPCPYAAGNTTSKGCVASHNCPSDSTSNPETHRDCVYRWSECNAKCKREFQVVAPPKSPFKQCPNESGKMEDCAPGEGKCPLTVCGNLDIAACKNEALCAMQGESCVELQCNLNEKSTCNNYMKCLWSSKTNKCETNTCFTHTGEAECATNKTCYWDDDTTLSHRCKPDECVALQTEACNATKHCFVNFLQNNACTPTQCGISHTTVKECHSDPKCFYNTHTKSCKPNVCQSITDSVRCTGINACWLDKVAQICRPDTCRNDGENLSGCLERPDCVSKVVEEKIKCHPGTCILVTDATQCEQRDDCVIGQQSPFECKENPCLALGFSGTADKCNAMDLCYHDGESCVIDVCKSLTKSECAGNKRCIYYSATSTCAPDQCSNHKDDRLKCKSVPGCHYEDIDFNADDVKSSKTGACVVSYCDNLSVNECKVKPKCYVDRGDLITCRANPCNAAATNNDECTKFNNKCTWNGNRCEPFPFCHTADASKCTTPWCKKTDTGCQPVTCNSITDSTVCDASTHCYRDNNDTCKENPCVKLSSSQCHANKFCELDDSVGHICKPKKPCAQMTDFYGPLTNCTTNTFCVKTVQNHCVPKECSQLGASECEFSQSGDRRCYLSSDQKCVTNACDSIAEEKKCKASGCLFDSSATSHRCSPDPCVNLSENKCTNTDGCIFLSSTQLCRPSVCESSKDQGACESHTFADEPIACHYNSISSTCGVNECGAWSGQRESCNARPKCAHVVKKEASKASCEIDSCRGKEQASCNGNCVYSSGQKQCLPISLCTNLDESSCGADKFCHWKDDSCQIDLCKGHPKQSCESDATCVFNTGKGKCQTNICDSGAAATVCTKTLGCFFGHKNGQPSSAKGCFPDRCSSFDTASTNSTDTQTACDATGYCQFLGGQCKPTKTCAVLTTTCSSMDKIAVGADVACAKCDVNECCTIIPKELTPSEKTKRRTEGLSEGARGTQPESIGIAGSSVALIVGVIAVAFILILCVSCFLWQKKTKKSGLPPGESDVDLADQSAAAPAHLHE